MQSFYDDDSSLSQELDPNFHGDAVGVASKPRPPILDYTNPILKMY